MSTNYFAALLQGTPDNAHTEKRKAPPAKKGVWGGSSSNSSPSFKADTKPPSGSLSASGRRSYHSSSSSASSSHENGKTTRQQENVKTEDSHELTELYHMFPNLPRSMIDRKVNVHRNGTVLNQECLIADLLTYSSEREEEDKKEGFVAVSNRRGGTSTNSLTGSSTSGDGGSGGGNEAERIRSYHRNYIDKFKTNICPQGNQCKDKGNCFSYHNTADRRRLPRADSNGKYNYYPSMCPFRLDCSNTKQCNLSHNRFEMIFHPLTYKTSKCTGRLCHTGKGKDDVCTKNGKHCAKAHSECDLRKPGQLFGVTPDDGFDVRKYKINPCVGGLVNDNNNTYCGCIGHHTGMERRRNYKVHFYTNKPCSNVYSGHRKLWGQPSDCVGGDDCQNSHTLHEVLYHPDNYKTLPCVQLEKDGSCRWGHRCAFQHSPADTSPYNDEDYDEVDERPASNGHREDVNHSYNGGDPAPPLSVTSPPSHGPPQPSVGSVWGGQNPLVRRGTGVNGGPPAATVKPPSLTSDDAFPSLSGGSNLINTPSTSITTPATNGGDYPPTDLPMTAAAIVAAPPPANTELAPTQQAEAPDNTASLSSLPSSSITKTLTRVAIPGAPPSASPKRKKRNKKSAASLSSQHQTTLLDTTPKSTPQATKAKTTTPVVVAQSTPKPAVEMASEKTPAPVMSEHSTQQAITPSSSSSSSSSSLTSSSSSAATTATAALPLPLSLSLSLSAPPPLQIVSLPAAKADDQAPQPLQLSQQKLSSDDAALVAPPALQAVAQQQLGVPSEMCLAPGSPLSPSIPSQQNITIPPNSPPSPSTSPFPPGLNLAPGTSAYSSSPPSLSPSSSFTPQTPPPVSSTSSSTATSSIPSSPSPEPPLAALPSFLQGLVSPAPSFLSNGYGGIFGAPAAPDANGEAGGLNRFPSLGGFGDMSLQPYGNASNLPVDYHNGNNGSGIANPNNVNMSPAGVSNGSLSLDDRMQRRNGAIRPVFSNPSTSVAHTQRLNMLLDSVRQLPVPSYDEARRHALIGDLSHLFMDCIKAQEAAEMNLKVLQSRFEMTCDLECTICFDREVECVFQCGHLFCSVCGMDMFRRGDQCPICAQPVLQHPLRAFFRY